MKVGTQGFVGERLKEGREARGITATSLASVLGVTRAAVSQYENGPGSPRPDVMERICQALGLPVEFFTRKRIHYQGPIFWRTQANPAELARKAARRRLDWLQDITAYVSEYIDFPQPTFPDVVTSSDPLRLTNEEIEGIANIVRSCWNLGDDPIPDAIALLEDHGVFISRDDLYVPALDGLSRWSKEDNIPFCLVASGKQSAVRSRMDVLHELGHLILHRDLDERYATVPMFHQLIEEQAFTFAGALALPAGPFADDIYSLSLDSFIGLKEKWKMAISAMVKRCGSLGIASESQLEKLWKGIAVRGWRKEEPLDDELPIERPYMLSRAIEIIIEQNIVSKEAIAPSLALPESDIEDITCLERGTLGAANPKLYSMPPPLFVNDPSILKETGSHRLPGKVVSFKKTITD